MGKRTARFHGSLSNLDGGSVTRTGTAFNGLESFIEGEVIGILVQITIDHTGHDLVTVWRTGGKYGPKRNEVIAQFNQQFIDQQSGSGAAESLNETASLKEKCNGRA